MLDFECMAKFHKALADPTRLKIIDFLLRREKCVCICELARLTGKDQSVVFRHIQALKDAKIACTHKEGNYLMCCIEDKKRILKYMEGQK